MLVSTALSLYCSMCTLYIQYIHIYTMYNVHIHVHTCMICVNSTDCGLVRVAMDTPRLIQKNCVSMQSKVHGSYMN